MGCGASSAAAVAGASKPSAASAASPPAAADGASPSSSSSPTATTRKGGGGGGGGGADATTIPPSPTMDAVVAFVPEPNTPLTPGRTQQTTLMTPSSAATTTATAGAEPTLNSPRDAAGGPHPAPVSRQSSVADVAVTLSRQQSNVGGADAEVSAVTAGAALAPPARTRTGRRASHTAHNGGGGPGENDWRNPKHAAELIAAQLAEDPHAFRDHVAIYWRLENMPPVPPPVAASPTHAQNANSTAATANSSRLHQPHAIHPSGAGGGGAGNGEGRVLVLHPSASSVGTTPHATPPPAAASSHASASAPLVGPSSSPPPSTPPILPVADQVSVFLSIGPSSGAGDKIGSSETRPLEKSIAFYPMLLAYSGLNGGDPNFSMQVQVWQRRVPGSASIAAMGHNHAIPMARDPILSLLGYVDVSILHLFSSFEKSQGLLLKPAPLSALPPGTQPTALPGSMIVVDYIQFYIHTTAAVGSSRWPKQLASPQSDCLWRAQMQALKLAPPRGCPHPAMQGSMMSPALGAIIASGLSGSPSTNNLSAAGTGGAAGLTAAAAAASGAGGPQVGACFFQIFKGVYPERAAVAATVAPSLGSSASAQTVGAGAGATNEPSPSHHLQHSAAPSPVFGATGTGTAGPPMPCSWTLVHTSEFVSLSRYPKFLEFQRPIADICEGSYNDVALLIQMVLTHDNLTQAVVAQIMPPGCTHTDPAAALTSAVKAEGMTVCSLVQSVTCMRELLQGKTKLRLHAPGEEGSASGSAFGRASTFTLGGSMFDGAGASDGGGDYIAPAAASSGPHGPSGAGTLAFSISQIFSSRASLEALARLKIARVTRHASQQPVAPAADGSTPAATPPSDGFDEAGVIRSTAYLASLLPAPQGRRHHRPGSHLRGPSALGGGGALDLSPAGGPLSAGSHGHGHGHGHGHPPPHPPQRSKTLGALSGAASGTLSPIASAIDEGGAERGGSASAGGEGPAVSVAGSSSGMAALLQRMGLQKAAPVNNRVSLDQGAAGAAAASSKRRSM